MASLFGSKTKSTTVTEPWTKEWNSKATDLYSQYADKSANPTAYTGPLNAGTNDLITGSSDYVKNMLNNSTLQKIASGGFLTADSNPYMTGTAKLATDALEKSMGTTYDNINSRFGGAGGLFNSSAKRNMAMRAADDLGTQKQTLLQSMYSKAYDTNMSNMMTGLGLQKDLVSTANNIGTTQQSTDQANLTRQYQEWLRQQGVTDDAMTAMMQMLSLAKTNNSKTTQKTSGLFG